MLSGGRPVVKKAIAWIGILILVGLYVNLLIRALSASPDTFGSFIACAAGTVAIPILIWLALWVYTRWSGRHTIASPPGDDE